MVTSIADFHRKARRKLPGIVFDYVEGGAYEEETLRRNRKDLQALALLPRALNDVSVRTTTAMLVGELASMPAALTPVGALGITYPNGEVHAAKAALQHGIPFCLSTLSIGTIEDVAEATKAPFWFQLYLTKDRSVGKALIERAAAAGCSALVLSVDLHVRSQRHREQKHGLVAPPRITIGNVFDALTHLRWLLPMVHSRRRTFGNFEGLVKDAKNVFKLTTWLEEQFDPTISTKEIEWLRSIWPGKLIVKGLMHPDDARLAVAAGADAVVVSNHGGRQVDGVLSTVHALPAVVDAVKGRAEVFVDGGIRTGIDMLKMLALGADGCFIGRAFIYGLAVDGEEGVCRALDILHHELHETMALCGATDIRQLPGDLLSKPETSSRNTAYLG